MEKVTNEGASIPWDKFSQWIHCVAVVTFDLELGQALEVSSCSVFIGCELR